MPTTADLTQLSLMASEYGPFFFALLFTLVVPFIGQAFISRNIRENSHASPAEIDALLHSQALYRQVAVWLSVFLVIFSVIWWAAVQIWPPATAQAALDKRVREAFRNKVRIGTIYGIDDDDTFIVRGNDQSHYKVYLYPRRDMLDMQVDYIVVPHDDAITDATHPDDPITVQYGNFSTMKAMKAVNLGYTYADLPLCLKNGIVTLLKGVGTDDQPSFKDCK